MEKPRDGRKERRGPEAEAAPEAAAAMPPVDAPAEEPAVEKAGRPKEPKVKVTYSLPVSLARLIDVVSSELGVDACDLVARLIAPALRGCRRPTVPESLKGMFAPGKGTAT